ncbi:hypothetical protein SAMN06297251_113122 [Fulvimarina manganoxydans]|uniref:CoA-binding domain-containing protein n=1 Tax=Fulvimarina manganoxydans TaxID=937218 RepID=A0A1W2DB08_9HYPH|nr:CoA-binding protein [Fulvimarina manganoxydans]SMC94256.1 hypothetical protein SAMN06297251_113122 [Fulvimarina manganoxydans]
MSAVSTGDGAAPLVYSDTLIRRILSEVRTIALIGASAKEVRPSFFVLKYLLAKGFDVYPVNPGLAGQSILGREVFADLASVPAPIDMVDVFRGSPAVPGIVDEVLALNPLPKVLWLQLTVRHDEAAARAEAAGMTVIMDRCPKIEYGRLSGEIGWNGVNSRVLSSKKPVLGKGFQSFGLNRSRAE